MSLNQYLLAADLSVLNDGRSRGMNSQHGVVVVGIVLRVRLVRRNYGCGQRANSDERGISPKVDKAKNEVSLVRYEKWGSSSNLKDLPS